MTSYICILRFKDCDGHMHACLLYMCLCYYKLVFETSMAHTCTVHICIKGCFFVVSKYTCITSSDNRGVSIRTWQIEHNFGKAALHWKKTDRMKFMVVHVSLQWRWYNVIVDVLSHFTRGNRNVPVAQVYAIKIHIHVIVAWWK